MAVTYIPSTTLNGAITATQTSITLTSVSGVSKGMMLVCQGEAMKVISDPDATLNTCVVRRGVHGSQAFAHPTLATVYYGTPDNWNAVNTTTPGFLGYGFPFPVPGARATDGQGNVYVLVDLTTPSCIYNTVTISGDGSYTAQATVGGDQGPVGVTIEGGTSNQWVWAQIYGKAIAFDGTKTSAATSAYYAQAATSVSTPAIGLSAIAASTSDAFLIKGMFITGAATTDNAPTGYTSAVAGALGWCGVQVPVFLNYPYVTSYKSADVTSV